MGFMRTYKKLDNLCRDINGKGVTGYIEDMEQTPNGEYKVTGWKDDYYKLKHYRYIRNQISHETNADEENMCDLDDTKWVENFYKRILNQTDPLAEYRKATRPKKVQNSTQLKTTKKQEPEENDNSLPIFAAVIFIIIILVFIISSNLSQ